MDATIKAVENVNAESTSQEVPVFRVKPGGYMIASGARVKTAFAGVTYPTVKLGEGTLTESILKQQPIGKVGDLKPGGATVTPGFCEALNTGGGQKTEATRAIFATFESESGNLSSLSAGEIEFFIVYVD